MLSKLQRIQLDRYIELNPNELSADQITKLKKEVNNPCSDFICDESVDFKLWTMGYPSRQESFANLVKKITNNKKLKILEVGCGRTGRLARILSKEGLWVTGIDPKVEIEEQENVKFIKEKFEYTTFDVSSYDFVIAQEPCDATEHIVRACIEKRVPFIISLCGTPHKLLSGNMPKTYQEWYNYLLGISRENMKLRYISLDPLTITPILRSIF